MGHTFVIEVDEMPLTAASEPSGPHRPSAPAHRQRPRDPTPPATAYGVNFTVMTSPSAIA